MGSASHRESITFNWAAQIRAFGTKPVICWAEENLLPSSSLLLLWLMELRKALIAMWYLLLVIDLERKGKRLLLSPNTIWTLTLLLVLWFCFCPFHHMQPRLRRCHRVYKWVNIWQSPGQEWFSDREMLNVSAMSHQLRQTPPFLPLPSLVFFLLFFSPRPHPSLFSPSL